MSEKENKEKEILKKTLQKKIKELSALYEIGKLISSTLHLDNVLKLITQKAAEIMSASSCSLRLLNDSRKVLVLKCSYGLQHHSFKQKKYLNVGESIAGRVVQSGKPAIIGDISKEKRYKYSHLVKRKGLNSLLTVPLIQKDKIIGVLTTYSKELCRYTNEDAHLLSMFASQASIAIENASLYQQAEMGYTNTILTLSNLIDAKDNHTYGHSERVMTHSIKIAKALHLSDHDKDVLKYASLLHDIGKIGIDVGILRKPSKLNNEEWKIMLMHPVLGSTIVEQIGFLKELSPIILRHHERYDGKGYPGRLKNQRIPLGARILSVTDAYESMVSDRPYRKSLSIKKAKEELLKEAGKQFDPKIVKAFLKILR